jgi:hypothetical protein
MRIRTIIAAAAAPAALAGVLLGTVGQAAAPAAAQAAVLTASVSSTGTNGQVGHITGKNAITYQDAVFGLVQVNETQHPNFDTISAKFVGGQTAASLGMQPGQTGTVGWNSDFGTNQSSPASVHLLTGTLTYTINADGLGYTGQATYPAS